MIRAPWHHLSALAGLVLGSLPGSAVPELEIWYGEQQQVGNQGFQQADFNLLGHVTSWQEVDRLFWSLNGGSANPLQFRAFRRLARDGDFNADIPVSRMRPGENTVRIRAVLGDGSELSRSVTIQRKSGACPLPFSINWQQVGHPQDVGQVVDGRWEITDSGLRIREPGYDRLFIIGEQSWQDYEILTTVTIHEVPRETTALSGGNGLGIIWRFSGHVVGGFRDFPSGQPKWGYQPFGAIGWLRWPKGKDEPPFLQFYPGYSDHATDYGRFSCSLKTVYRLRMRCQTLPDQEDGTGVTRYSFKIWILGQEEPGDWTWSHIQANPDALRQGGCALVAHHVDATFGDIKIFPITAPTGSN